MASEEQFDDAWELATKKRIKEAFKLFDKDNNHPPTIPQDEVHTIIRYLGLYPKDTVLAKEILPDMVRCLATKYYAADLHPLYLLLFNTAPSSRILERIHVYVCICRNQSTKMSQLHS